MLQIYIKTFNIHTVFIKNTILMKINDIIKEEVNGILNEGLVMKDERFQFMQNVKNSTFNNYSSFTTEFDADITESDLFVNWSVSFWLNKNGIENLVIDIEGLSGEFNLEMYDRQTDEKKQDTVKDISEFEWKFIIGDANLAKGGGLYIKDLIFDFGEKTCVVTF